MIAAIARAAARQDKGIARVLYCFPEEHFILAAVQIDYASKVQSCDYLKMANVANPQTSKPEAEVRVSEPEVTLVSEPEVRDDEEEGPFWMGPLVDRSFCELLRTEFRCLIKSEAEKDYSSTLKSFFGEKHSRITKLLDQLIEEESGIPWYHCLSDICSKKTHPQSNNPESNNPESNNPESNHPESNNPRSNNPISNDMQIQNIPAKKKVIEALQKSGFRASATYFDSKCVKTNASETHLKEVILGIKASEA